MSNELELGADAALAVDDILVVLGQLFVAILTALVVAFANVDVSGLADAMSTLPLGDAAMMSNFTA